MTLQQLWMLFSRCVNGASGLKREERARAVCEGLCNQRALGVGGGVGGEVGEALNTSEEHPSPPDSCRCIKSATVNTACPSHGAAFLKHVSNKLSLLKANKDASVIVLAVFTF